MHAGRAFISPLPPEVTIHHFELYRESVAEDRPIVELEARPDKSYVLTVIGRERHGLLADLTNYLESVRLNVVQARIFSLPNDSIMDMFHLTDSHGVLVSNDAVKELHDTLFRLIGVPDPNPPIPRSPPPLDAMSMDDLSAHRRAAHTVPSLAARTTPAQAAPPAPDGWIQAFVAARPISSNLVPRQGAAARSIRRCLSNIVLSQVDSVEQTSRTQHAAQLLERQNADLHARAEQIVRDSEHQLLEGEWFYGYSADSLKRYRFRYNVSDDKTYLCWGDSYSVRLAHCVGVVFGPYSNVFREVGAARIEPDWLCFSLVWFPPAGDNEPLVPRTYDFVCVSDNQLNRWLLGLQALCRPHNSAAQYTLPGLILQRARFKIQAHAHARKLTIRQYILKRAREVGERKVSETANTKRDEEIPALEEAVRTLKEKLQDAACRETILNTTLHNVQAAWEVNFSEVTVVEVIGKGAFSDMWRGVWRSTPVAVKILKPNSSDHFRHDDVITNGTSSSPSSTETTGRSSLTNAANGQYGARPSADSLGRERAGSQSHSRRNAPRLSEEDARHLQEFHEEVTTLSKLRHPNIVLFMAGCARPPQLCILTEFCQGGSLFRALRQRSWRKRLSLNDLIVIARHIARGMRFLHACNIIHRDLKSQNLLLDRNVEEGCPVIKIADFGLSRRFKHGGPNVSMSGSTAGVMTSETGTYRWMAPEVIRHEPYNQKIDVYSYGVVIWELFACEIPFAGMTPIQAAFAVADKHLRPSAVSEYAKAMPIPVGWMALITRCWHPSPHFRPRFKDIVEALDQMQKVEADKMTAFWRNWDESIANRRRMRREAAFTTPHPHNFSLDQPVTGAILSNRASPTQMQRRGPPPGPGTAPAVRVRQQHTGLGHSGSAPNLRAAL